MVADAKKKDDALSAPPVIVSTASLRSHVEFLASGAPRNYRHPDRLVRAADYIAAELEKAGLDPVFQAFMHEGRSYRNVIANLNSDRKERIVIGAHYDVCGDQPGADDNASGVAALIELARVAQAEWNRIPYHVEFVAYANEEPPFFRTEGMGSYHHARGLKETGQKVRLMVALESVGYFRNEENSQRYPPLYGLFRPSEGNFIAIVSRWGHGDELKGIDRAFDRGSRLPTERLSAPPLVAGVDFSDHLNYWAFGFKAVMITDTAFYRNANYHQPTDTPDTLDYARMAEVVKGIATFLLAP